jgi:hypothetical protein
MLDVRALREPMHLHLPQSSSVANTLGNPPRQPGLVRSAGTFERHPYQLGSSIVHRYLS